MEEVNIVDELKLLDNTKKGDRIVAEMRLKKLCEGMDDIAPKCAWEKTICCSTEIAYRRAYRYYVKCANKLELFLGL